jgi:hypothetical protein
VAGNATGITDNEKSTLKAKSDLRKDHQSKGAGMSDGKRIF